jgi:N-acetylneuraminic acid mutarotase
MVRSSTAGLYATLRGDARMAASRLGTGADVRTCGVLYCAGGTQDFGNVSRATYAYDPAADTWNRRADVPMALWEMGYGVANGKLLISGGVNSGVSTNKGFAYDPVADS